MMEAQSVEYVELYRRKTIGQLPTCPASVTAKTALRLTLGPLDDSTLFDTHRPIARMHHELGLDYARNASTFD